MGSEARTRLALIGLHAVTLFSFSQLFADGDYPGPAALGMLIAAGIAILGRRFGVSILLTAIASLVTLTTYLAFIFQTKNTFYGLPTPGAVRGLVDAVKQAIDRAELDFAPVPVRPGYVIMVVAGLWIAAVLGEVATFRWRKPLIASVTPVVLFSVVMVVGTGAGTPLFVAMFLISPCSPTGGSSPPIDCVPGVDGSRHGQTTAPKRSPIRSPARSLGRWVRRASHWR